MGTHEALKTIEIREHSVRHNVSDTPAQDRPPGLRIVLTSSLGQSSLNNHILDGVFAALSAHSAVANVRYAPPQDVVRSANLDDSNLLIFMGSAVDELTPHYTISSMARMANIPSVFWATDDPYEFDFRFRANGYDLYISNDINAARNMLERENVFHIPLAAPPTDKREITPHVNRAKGIFFCGYPFANRKLIVEEISNIKSFSHSDLIVSGPNWDHAVCGILPSPTSHEMLIDIYGNSEFVLNMGRSFNVANDQYNLVASTPGPRTFECALAGTPQLYFGNETEVEQFFVPDEEILVCNSVEDIERHVIDLRSEPTRWESIAERAQERAHRDHLYINRVDNLLSVCRESGVMCKDVSKISIGL